MEDTQGTVERDHQPSQTFAETVDNRDYCFCGTEIPPGPDFCSTECEAKALSQKPKDDLDHPSVAKTMAEDALKPKDKPLTETQFRALRRAFFTVRHDRVPECGHRSDKLNEPRNNCEYCWFFWLSGHGELVQTADRAFQEQGSEFLTRMRGRKFTRMFVRYMSTLAQFQKEAAEKAEKEKQNDVNERSESEVRGDQQSGNRDGQEVRTDRDISESGEERREGDTIDSDRLSLS